MTQDDKIILLIVQESLIEGDATPDRQKDLAAMLERVLVGETPGDDVRGYIALTDPAPDDDDSPRRKAAIAKALSWMQE